MQVLALSPQGSAGAQCAAAPAGSQPSAAERWLWLGYVLFAYAAYGYLFGRLPIFAGDTDLWYHLNGGRYFWDSGQIANHSFFSFVDPPRQRVDYYWLFQVVVYKIHQWAGYPGLIAARTLLFLSFLSAGLALFRPTCKNRGESPAVLAAVVVVFLLAVVAVPRYTLLRPHTVSYLLALVFILVIERQRRWAPVLPLLAVVWVNVHGVTYPVLWIIACAYLGELGLRRLRGGSLQRSDWLLAACLLLAALCVYVTPFGYKLLAVPFTSTHYAGQYIEELKNSHWRQFASFHFGTLAPTPQTAFNLLAALALYSLVRRLRAGCPRLSHLLLVAGAVVLLFKGRRLTVEFSILALPALLDWARGLRADHVLRQRLGRWVGSAAVLFCIVSVVYGSTADLPRYPFSAQNLPVGVTTFLRQVGGGGRVLNDHNTGGFTQWALYPEYTIYMDMEVPFLFTDQDMFRSLQSFTDATVLGQTLEQYRPEFISASLRFQGFPELIEKYPHFQPVFFDQTEVLYADAERRPELVERYAYRALDPFRLVGKKLAELREEWDETQAVAELRRTLEVAPESALPNQVLAMVLRDRKEYAAALPHAEVVAEQFPTSAIGHTLMADALRGLGRDEEALAAFERAVATFDAAGTRKAYRQMGLLLSELERYEEAYAALHQGVEVYAPATGHEDLFYLASAAFLTERLEEARGLIEFAYEKVPPEDTEWRERLEKYLEIFGLEPWKKPS